MKKEKEIDNGIMDISDLIKSAEKDYDSVYEPIGETTWRLPTGIVSLDKMLGGGLPGGALVQLYGQEKSGKTSLAYRIVGKAVEAGYPTLLVPIEGYSKLYAEACGVDTTKLGSNGKPLFNKVSADYAEAVFNLVGEGLRNTNLMVVVMDSIGAAIPKANIEKKQKESIEEAGFNMGLQARVIGDFITKIQSPIRRKQALFVTVNQMRNDIGKWGGGMKPMGGNALQYYSDIKLNMWGKEDPANKDTEIKISVNKGKEWSCVSFSTTTVHVAHAKGFDIERDIVDYCVEAGIIKRGGAWYTYGTNVKCQGLPSLIDTIRNNPTLMKELTDKAMETNVVNIEVPEEGTENVDDKT
jgi:recombination protein RecA